MARDDGDRVENKIEGVADAREKLKEAAPELRHAIGYCSSLQWSKEFTNQLNVIIAAALARSHQSEVPREPTQAMLDAAYEAGLRGADDSDEEGSESSARAIWKAMYDAALASPVEGDRKDAEHG